MAAIDNWEELAQYIENSEKPVFVRWSDGPEEDREMGRSLNHQTGRREQGISVQRIDNKDLSKVGKRSLVARMLIEYAFGRPTGYICKGEINGEGSDGEETIQAETISDVKVLDDGFVSDLSDYAQQYDDYKDQHDELLTPPVDFDEVKSHQKPDPVELC